MASAPTPPELREIQIALSSHGIEPDKRAIYNVQSLLEHLHETDGPHHLSDELGSLSTSADDILSSIEGAADRGLALNGLERIASQLSDLGEATSLRNTAVRARVALLCGAGEPFVEFLVPCLKELADPDFPAGATTSIPPFPCPEGDLHPRSRALARWYRKEMLRICLAELEGHLDVEETARVLTSLADRTVEAAFTIAGGNSLSMAVIALGKWGGCELNYSSDIDLFFIRDNDEDLTAAETVARGVLRILAGYGGLPHLYRTDLRLRPGGPTGPLVPSIAQARAAFRTPHPDIADIAAAPPHRPGGADTWERIVFIRSRPVVDRTQGLTRLVEEIEAFVYERPFDLDEIRKLKGYKSVLEASAARDDEDRQELKVGWGGIRDVEYLVQFLQLLHGQVYRSIRGGNVFQALRRLGRIGALTATETALLLEGYRFLRRVEHHMMLRHRQQSFRLPDQANAQEALARAIGLTEWDRFLRELDRRRSPIRDILEQLFHQLFRDPGSERIGEVHIILAFRPRPEVIEEVFAPLRFRDPQKAYMLLRRLAYPRRKELRSPRARHYLAHLFPQLLSAIAATPDPDQATLMFTSCVETLGAPAVFYQLLAENPETCTLFVDLFGRSRFVSELLLNHPGTLDEIIDRLRTLSRSGEEGLYDELKETLARVSSNNTGSALHEFRALHTVEVAILDLSGKLPLLRVLRRLSAIARATLRALDERAVQSVSERWGKLRPIAGEPPPRYAILALGRLGGNEIGYASDIDQILVYDGRGETDSGIGEREFYTQVLQKIIADLGNPGSSGPLYRVDLRLRPRGASGALVHSFRDFCQYFKGPESQIWEHQALTRCSPAAGDPDLAASIIEFARSNLGRELQPELIIAQLLEMHERRLETATPVDFQIKAGPGGILDIEFLVQSLIILHSREFSDLWEPNTAAAIQLLAEKGLLSGAEEASLSTAYLFFRLVENRLGMLQRSSVRTVSTDDESLRDLATRIGYLDEEGTEPHQVLLEELRYHTKTVRKIFEARYLRKS